MKKWLTALVGAAIILAGFRTAVVLYYTDPGTGFYKAGEAMPAVFMGTVFVVCLLFFLVFMLLKPLPKGKLDYEKLSGKGLAAAFGLLTAGLAADFCVSFFTLTKGAQDALTVLLFVAAAAAAFCGAIMTSLLAAARPRLERTYLLFVIAVWGMLQCIVTFRSYRTIASISEHLFDILASLSIMLFLFFLGKCFYGEHSARTTAAFGSLALLTSAVSLAPQLTIKLARIPEIYIRPLAPKDFVYAAVLLLVPMALGLLPDAEESETVEEQP